MNERYSVLLIAGIFLVPMLILSTVLWRGHGASLIAGYNTMSPEEQKKWDAKALCRFTGVMLFVFTLFLGAAMASAAHSKMSLFWVFFGCSMVEIIGGVIYINKSKRFKR